MISACSSLCYNKLLFLQRREPAHSMPVFSSLSVLLLFDTMEKFLVLMWFHALIALNRSRFVLQMLSCTFESSVWGSALLVAFHPTVSEFRAAHLQHDAVALCDLSSPLPVWLLSIKNLNSNCPEKKSPFSSINLFSWQHSSSIFMDLLVIFMEFLWFTVTMDSAPGHDGFCWNRAKLRHKLCTWAVTKSNFMQIFLGWPFLLFRMALELPVSQVSSSLICQHTL